MFLHKAHGCHQDPYILRNHLGSLECRLCLTLHTNEGSYLAHTQGKKHQTNLARRAAKDNKDAQLMIAPAPSSVRTKVFLKIGRPGYRVTKVRERVEYDHLGQRITEGEGPAREGLMVQVHLPQVKEGVVPRKRFMSAWEQRKEPPNRAYQYLIVSCSVRPSPHYQTKWGVRSQPNHTKQLHSGFQLVRLKMNQRTVRDGIGPSGIQIPSSTASSSCSATDVVLLYPYASFTSAKRRARQE